MTAYERRSEQLASHSELLHEKKGRIEYGPKVSHYWDIFPEVFLRKPQAWIFASPLASQSPELFGVIILGIRVALTK